MESIKSVSERRGDIAITLGVLSLIIALAGMIAGSSSTRKSQTTTGRAQQTANCTYHSINEIRMKDPVDNTVKVLRGVAGFRWQNNFIDPKTGVNFEADFTVASPEAALSYEWRVPNLNAPDYAPYKNQNA